MESQHVSRPIVIVGAGIIGLDTALALARRGMGKSITVLAEHLPGDTSKNYASPWAGANFSAISGSDANALRWDRIGYENLMNLSSQYGQQSFIKKTRSIEYWDDPVSQQKLQSLSQFLEDFHVIPESELPSGVSSGIAFTTVTLNAPKHLEWLYNLLKSEYDVKFVHCKLSNIREAYSNPHVRVVFNCTGGGAKVLDGVQDAKCYPTRGQILLAKVPHVTTNMMRHGRDYLTYIIPRPWSNGNAVLGGFLQKGVSTSDTFARESESIFKRTFSLSSELREGPKAEILATLAGLRPSREGGARVEKSTVRVDGVDRVLVHNYGAGGAGYQAGHGMATDAVNAVDDVLSTLPQVVQARL